MASLSIKEEECNSDDESNQTSFLNRIPDCCGILPKLESEDHHILCLSYFHPGNSAAFNPSSYEDKWDFSHVRMPCSSQSKHPVKDSNGEKVKSRWDLICCSLQRSIKTSQDLEESIMEYNYEYRNKWNFHSLHAFFNQCISDEERIHFFEILLPAMIGITLDIMNIFTQPPPLLKKNKDQLLSMSQKQISCLLLNAFFCTFPCRNNYSRRKRFTDTDDEYSTYPDINFNRLFFGVKNRILPRCAEKLKCLLNYFKRITSKEPTGMLTFHRQFLRNLPVWSDSTKNLKRAIVKSSGLIETDGGGLLQVDFANKFVGGGVLGHGCVQEEIRFSICPELIVSRLFVESLNPTEALIITGAEQYSIYSGYGDNFKWEGDFQDKTAQDTWGRKYTKIVAMDATHFRSSCEQYKPFRIERELNKAFCGFYEDVDQIHLLAVATGNWGCGAFKGNPILKFIIQLMAASQANRDILYFTFGSKPLKVQLQEIYKICTKKKLTVGDLWNILVKYFNTAKENGGELFPSLFDFMCSLNEESHADKEYSNVVNGICNNKFEELVINAE